ncbi:MAG: hypothetical protein SFX18_00280 [Pirellulales bacterium]|nr:hypothetical protein [Pirellulales bacterium]
MPLNVGVAPTQLNGNNLMRISGQKTERLTHFAGQILPARMLHWQILLGALAVVAFLGISAAEPTDTSNAPSSAQGFATRGDKQVANFPPATAVLDEPAAAPLTTLTKMGEEWIATTPGVPGRLIIKHRLSKVGDIISDNGKLTAHVKSRKSLDKTVTHWVCVNRLDHGGTVSEHQYHDYFNETKNFAFSRSGKYYCYSCPRVNSFRIIDANTGKTVREQILDVTKSRIKEENGEVQEIFVPTVAVQILAQLEDEFLILMPNKVYAVGPDFTTTRVVIDKIEEEIERGCLSPCGRYLCLTTRMGSSTFNLQTRKLEHFVASEQFRPNQISENAEFGVDNMKVHLIRGPSDGTYLLNQKSFMGNFFPKSQFWELSATTVKIHDYRAQRVMFELDKKRLLHVRSKSGDNTFGNSEWIFFACLGSQELIAVESSTTGHFVLSYQE